MKQIAICDDDSESLRYIHSLAENFLKSRGFSDVSLNDFNCAQSFIAHLENIKKVDIALLDVCMGDFSGIEVAKRIRAKNCVTKIIFFAQSAEFAVEAFSVNASHYLVKPFSQAEFEEAMERVSDVLKTSDKQKQILITEKGKITTVIAVSDIDYIESIGYHRYVHTKQKLFVEVVKTLSAFLQELNELSPDEFISPYRGYIVNLSSIRTITSKSIKMKDGTSILIKPGEFKQIKAKFF